MPMLLCDCQSFIKESYLHTYSRRRTDLYCMKLIVAGLRERRTIPSYDNNTRR